MLLEILILMTLTGILLPALCQTYITSTLWHQNKLTQAVLSSEYAYLEWIIRNDLKNAAIITDTGPFLSLINFASQTITYSIDQKKLKRTVNGSTSFLSDQSVWDTITSTKTQNNLLQIQLKGEKNIELYQKVTEQ